METSKISRRIIGMNVPVWIHWNPRTKKWLATVHLNAEASAKKDEDEAYNILLSKLINNIDKDKKEFEYFTSS